MSFSSLDDLPRWFRAHEHSIRWFAILIQREIDFHRLFEHRYIVVIQYPGEETPPPVDILGENERDELERIVKDCMTGEGELVLIRDQEDDVFLKPYLRIEFEQDGEPNHPEGEEGSPPLEVEGY